MSQQRRLTSGQRALLQFWREQGLADADGLCSPGGTERLPLHRIQTPEGYPLIRSWSALFEVMDAYNGMAHYFEIDLHLELWEWHTTDTPVNGVLIPKEKHIADDTSCQTGTLRGGTL